MNAFECFKIFQALKLHFTTDYEYFKYNGKTNVSIKTFEKRKDRFYFLKLSKKYIQENDLILFFVANFIENNCKWVGDFLSEKGEQNFQKHQKILESMSYVFESDCRKLFDNEANPNNVLLVTDGNYPILLTKYLQSEIELETLCLLNIILKFLDDWKEQISDTIQYPEVHRKIEKFTCFLPKDVVKYKLILKRIINRA